jgi:endonuclease/exonuclease/phosphatase family metal-dependent hydrolase
VSLPIRLLVALTSAAALSSGVASAQTTLTLSSPEAHVTDATIGSGTAANTISNNDRLSVRRSTDVNAGRRALLKFNTETTMPATTSVTSATLSLYVRAGAGTTTRRIGVYRLTKSFQETQATWITRKTGYKWTIAGGDLGTKVGELSVPTTAGAKVSVNVTAAVQESLKDASSRYTRLALIDLSTADATSYREFHSSEATTASLRPTLVVKYGTATTAAPAPAPAPSTSTTSAGLKVLDWNTHYGKGMDGKYNIDRIATFIAKFNPDVVSLNEVTRYAYYNTAEDQAPRYAALLKAKTGRTWYYTYRTDNGASKGVGNMVLSRFPIASTSHCQLSTRRVAVNAAIYVNGRLLNVWSTHLDSSTSDSMRIAEIKALHACVGSFAEQKIIAGDFNAWPAKYEISLMASGGFTDTWAKAASLSQAYSYPGNTSFGATRNSRIDFIWTSSKATALVVKRSEVFDTRDANGYMPSDHKPVMTTFEVK